MTVKCPGIFRPGFPGFLPGRLDGVHFRCDLQDLGHPWTDLDENFGVYRVHPETMHCRVFDFRFRPENRKLEFSRKPDYNPM